MRAVTSLEHRYPASFLKDHPNPFFILETRVDLERFHGPSVRSFRIFFLFDRAQTLQALFGRSEMVGVAAP